MRKILMFPLFVAFALSLACFSSCSIMHKSAKKQIQNAPAVSAAETCDYYTCPAHEDVKSPNPGKCPKCGRNLEKPPFRHAIIDTDTTTK